MDLHQLYPSFGQSVWLDYIRRSLLEGGELARLVNEDGIRGVTSNPSIFEKAIAGSTDYDAALERYEKKRDATASDIYDHLAVEDIQRAADILLRVYEGSARRDGYVSMEVSPYLARDTQATVEEAVRLWTNVHRSNLMIKVPATPEGTLAIRTLIGRGINVNATLLFSRAMCQEVAIAYVSGLEDFDARGGDLSRVASVASMFVSRLDALVTPMLEGRARTAGPKESAELKSLVGKVAIANAKLAYDDWKKFFGGSRWLALAARGAQTQRLLWASTSTKDPRFSDVLYVESLIGRDTVDTIPPATLDAFRDHGKASNSLEANIDDAQRVLATLADVGISTHDLTTRLLDEGLNGFSAAFDTLLGSIEKKRDGVLKSARDRMTYWLPASLGTEVAATLEDWRTSGKVRRLWGRDASLWTGRDEKKWLDWLNLGDGDSRLAEERTSFAKAAQLDFRFAVVLGMGGSSLCPDVLSRTFARVEGCPELHVLDSTDPAQIRAMEARIEVSKTLFIVSSKSGSTLEPNILMEYFYNRVSHAVGAAHAGKHFIAITDDGSPLQSAAESRGLARVFLGDPGVGGRFSALTNFGMVPAAIMGVDVPRFLERATIMAHACASCVPPERNPGVLLGAILGTAARGGRDKVTLVASPGITQIGAWLEQLLAESTGKQGKGIIPIDREPLGVPEAYGQDRLFVYLRLDASADRAQDETLDAIEKFGHPVVRIALADPDDLGQEFFRWEIAIAVAGAIMGIDAFNQPDVEASKVVARKLTDSYELTGALPNERAFYEEGPIRLFADERNCVALGLAAGEERSLRSYLRAHFHRLQLSDYFAILAYVERNEAHDTRLQAIRRTIRDSRKVATCAGFGPRFLHSTGQLYKGGPNSGVFLQITCDEAEDVEVPGHRFTFGIVKAAQARGDFHVLAQRGRRALRVHLGPSVGSGLKILCEAIERALN